MFRMIKELSQASLTNLNETFYGLDTHCLKGFRPQKMRTVFAFDLKVEALKKIMFYSVTGDQVSLIGGGC